MKRIVLLSFVMLMLVACPKTETAKPPEVPAQGSGSGSGSARALPPALVALPATGPAAPSPTPDLCPLAKLFASKWGKVLGDCSCWTADSVLCSPSPTSLLWCEAKPDAKPHCEIEFDWTPRQQLDAGSGSAAVTEGKVSPPPTKTAPPIPPGKK